MPAQKGFTLVELLVVIVILSILGVIVIAVLNPGRLITRTKDTVLNYHLRTFGYVINSLHSADDAFPYGSGGGFPIEMTVNRGAAGTTFICMSQKRGSDDTYVAYGVGDGTLTRNSPTGCYNGVAVQP